MIDTLTANWACWGEEQTEHIARLAAEIQDTETESLCDEVHAGLTDLTFLIAVVRAETRYTDWMERGINLGWETRT